MPQLLPIPIVVELSPDVAEALDILIAAQTIPKMTRAEAIDYALRDWLTGLGVLPFHDSPSELN